MLCMSMSVLYGQGETDALKFAQSDISGSARYMGMAGAFGALGGDISSLTQNPAGIGVYRSSEMVATFGFENMANEVSASGGDARSSDFRFMFNNIGAIGTLNTGKTSGLLNFNFGFAYNRLKNFNRSYQAKFNNLETSLTNYIADKTNGISVWDLTLTDNYDPYDYLSWLPVLAYESSLISPYPDSDADYFGLFNGPNTIGYYNGSPTSSGSAGLWVTEKGRIDEYTLNLGGNISDRIYFGLGVGILDINYTQRTDYMENITNPEYLGPGEVQPNGSFNLRNYLHTRGTGVNLKLGLMARLTNYWRVGLAFHTPTVYTMRDEYAASVRNTAIWEPADPADEQSTWVPIERSTPDNHIYYTDYRYSSAWKLMASTAFILGKKGLVSFDYEYTAYNRMRLSDADGVALYGDYDSNVDDFIRTDFKGGHTLRLGGEYRPTTQFTLRAGYAAQLSPVTKTVFDMDVEVVTAGTQPMYTLNRDTHYVTAGAGYRFGRLYLDAAYVHRINREDVLPYSPVFIGEAADMPEVAKLTGHTNSLVLTLGYKF